MSIRSQAGSHILYSKEWNIVEAEIIESSKALLGSSVRIGMSKEEFILLDFKKYHSCFDKFNSISFPYGMNFNELKYSFDNDQRLSKINLSRYPD